MQNNIGIVIGTFSAKKGQSGLPRPNVESLNIIKNSGIKNDKFAGLDINKNVMVVGLIAYEIAKKNGIILEYGSLGENILLDLNPNEYGVGKFLKINNVILEITQSCTICNHLSVFDKKLPKLIKDFRGVYCKIIESGEVKKDMNISFLEDYEK